MKILFLITEGSESVGGIGQFNSQLMECLPDATVLNLKKSGSKIIFLWRFFKTLRNQNFDAVLCGHLHLSPLVKFFCKKIPKKILIIHGIEAWKKSRHAVVNFSVKVFDYLISVSNVTQERFLNWVKPDALELFILPNCVDLERFTPDTPDTNLIERYHLKGKKVLLTLARLSAEERYKGIDEVIELLTNLKKHIPNVKYLIAGSGPDQVRLEQKAQKLGVRHLVEFAGFVPEALKVKLYQLADIFVMPGLGEGFGIVYLEAMACGIPTIASNLDGGREALQDGNLGILVNPHHRAEIEKAILTAILIPKARPQGLENFSKENFKMRVQQILEQL